MIIMQMIMTMTMMKIKITKNNYKFTIVNKSLIK